MENLEPNLKPLTREEMATLGNLIKKMNIVLLTEGRTQDFLAFQYESNKDSIEVFVPLKDPKREFSDS